MKYTWKNDLNGKFYVYFTTIKTKKIKVEKDKPNAEFDPWVGKIPWRRARQPTPVSLLENPHG